MGREQFPPFFRARSLCCFPIPTIREPGTELYSVAFVNFVSTCKRGLHWFISENCHVSRSVNKVAYLTKLLILHPT